MKFGFIGHKVHRHGGMERAAAEVLERVAQKHEVVVLARECEVQAARLRWVPVHPIPRPNAALALSFAAQARRLERRLGCDVTNTIGAAAVSADVITAQFCHAAFHARHGQMRAGRSPLRRAYTAFAERLFTAQERHAYTAPRLKKVIAVSQGVKRELIASYGVPAGKIAVIPNAVDHAVFRPAPSAQAKRDLRIALGLPEAAFVCLFVGGDWERKGLADAVRAVAAVPDCVFIVVGKGDEDGFRTLARNAGAEDRILFTGPTLRTQDYYAAADVFVFPSRYEAFSLVTIEAAAAGLPIIALKINGTEELIEDGVNGFFVEATPDSIQTKLLLLKEDRAILCAMSEAALESSRPYTWHRVAAEQIEIFEGAAA